MKKERYYLCIDLKSFYASVECVERGLDPMKAKLVVADRGRTEKTICLAVSPAMKSLGVANRCRVFQIPKTIDYLMARPRMQLYLDYSARIYRIYLRYISKDDIHVYSIDEVFMDVTDYLSLYRMSPKELGIKIMEEVFAETGIPAACGIGTNLYLAKAALDILAKQEPDKVAFLDEERYREKLWNHRPLKDFWRIGSGTARRLERLGIYTMEEIAHADENVLFKIFGVDAELLLDHAWGRETTTMADIKDYEPQSNSISSGQVLSEPYSFEKGKLLVKEMADVLALELLARDCATDSITLHIGYSRRIERKPAHGTIAIPQITNSVRKLIEYTIKLYERIVDHQESIYRISLTFNHIIADEFRQYDLFSNPTDLEKEYNMQKAILEIKERYGKNAILRGMNLEEGAKTIERNQQIGGHRQ